MTEPLYNSRITKNYLEYLKVHHPEADIASLLDQAGMTLQQIEDGGHWFTQEDVDRFHEVLVRTVGDEDISRKVGRHAALSAAAGDLKQYILTFIHPSMVYQMLGRILSRVSRASAVSTRHLGGNRAEITVRIRPGVEEKPYQCENRMGTLESAGRLFGHDFAQIDHPTCIHRGEDACRYILSWETSPSLFWKRLRNLAIPAGAILSAVLFLRLDTAAWLNGTVAILAALAVLALWTERMERRDIEALLSKRGEHTSQLLDQIDASYNHALLVHEIGQATANLMDTRELLRAIMKSMERLLPFDRGSVLLANPEKTKLRYADGYGYKADMEHFLQHTEFNLDNPRSRGPFVVAFREQKPFLIDDIERIHEGISAKSREYARIMGVRSFICVPILYEGQSMGLLAVDNIRSHRLLKQSDLNILNGIASQIGVSINRVRTYQKVLESEERFRNLSENSLDIIVTAGSDGAFTYVNPAWERILGYSRRETMGRYLTDFLKPEAKRKFIKLFRKIRDKNETVRDFSGVLLDQMGRERLFVMNAAPNIDSEGRLTGVVGTFKDITEQRHMEEQLHHASKMEAIGTLTGGIAHDFNNMLHTMSGYNQILLRKHAGHEDWRHLNSIQDLTERAADLVKQLLFFSRRVGSRPQRLDLNREIHSLYELLYRTIPRMIAIRMELSSRPCIAYADPVQISQVIMNLMVNARDAMPDGGSIVIRTSHVSLGNPVPAELVQLPPGDFVCMSIQDTGCGMEHLVREHIFDPFFTTKEAGKGTGLGLSVAYGIIKNHGGMIICDSEPGKGSTFRVYLPVCHEEITEADNEECASGHASAGGTLLMVDDNSSLLEIGQDMLGAFGYRVMTAESGEEAVELFRREMDRIDLVLLDMIMPGMGGAKCMEEILRLKPDAKIVISSGCLPDEAMTEIIQNSASGYVRKPYRFDELSHEIARMLHTGEKVVR
ncbi:MAG: PAS domain S-box protein [Syntrophales bacterium]